MLVAVMGMFVSSPARYMQSFFNGLTVWAYNVLPALFPFAVLSTIATKLCPKRKFSLTQKLFGVSCDEVYMVSLLCGYPMGAKALSETDADADSITHAAAFCSTVSPIFVIGTIGARLLQNALAALVVLIAQIASSLLTGLVYRPKKKLHIDGVTHGFAPSDIGTTITNTALSVISVGGLIALFYMMTDMVCDLMSETVRNSPLFAFAIGLLEMTNGVIAMCSVAPLRTATVLCSTLLAFGGLCVFCQCYAFLGSKHISPWKLLQMKCVQAAFATVISYALVKLLL